MAIALRTGRLSAEEVWDSLTWRQWQDWRAFNQISPIGDERFDVLHALQLAMWAGPNTAFESLLPPWYTNAEEYDDEFAEAVLATLELERRGDQAVRDFD